MGSRVINEYEPEVVSAPGETLKEVLDDRGMTQAELAARTGRPTKTINEIIKGKAAITPETAQQLEHVFGIPASFWNNLDRHYREYRARVAEQERLKEHVAWLKEIPVAAMVRLGWIRRHSDRTEQVRACLGFFGVASPDQWREVYSLPNAAFRRSPRFEGSLGAVSAWLRQGELLAGEILCDPFNRRSFHEALREARELTVEPPQVLVGRLVALCARGGVAVVFLRRPPRTPVSGATRWLSPRKALIQLSLRYKTNDHLWFTFFHEACHVLRHGKKLVFLETDGPNGPAEEEADRFASDLLIPPEDYKRIRDRAPYSFAQVRAFAGEIGIAPGIVVGRLQHDGYLPMKNLNALKLRLEWQESE